MRTPVVTLLTLAGVRVASAAPETRCVVHGDDVTIEKVTVNGFTVGVSGVSADATVTSGRPGVTLDVGGVIAFQGTTTQLWFTVSIESIVGAGLVTMSPGAHLIGDQLDGTNVAGAAVLYAMDTMEGEDKPADEAVGAVSVPCAHLTLDWSRDPVNPPAPTGKGWRSRAQTLTFHTAPKQSSPSVTYSSSVCGDSDCLNVQGSAASNGYRKVGVVNESVSIVGWVKASELRRIPDDEGFGHSYMCTGDHHGTGTYGFSGKRPPVTLANLAPGTKIHDAPKGTAWATVTRDEVFEVRYAKGDAWAEIVYLPGITDPEGHAYVPVSALVKPRAKP